MPLFWLDPSSNPMLPLAAQMTPRDDGLVALGGVLSPRSILEAYQKGVFPWSGDHPIPWYSPDPRLILEPSKVKIRRSLRQRMKHFEVRFDTRFHALMSLCANIPRPGQGGTWIKPNMVAAWVQLHKMGFAHSVEVYQNDEMVGGLYGLALGKAFFGESMASLVPDASKTALVTLCKHLTAHHYHFIDCQQDTPHMRSMGGQILSRDEYLHKLKQALDGSQWPAHHSVAPSH